MSNKHLWYDSYANSRIAPKQNTQPPHPPPQRGTAAPPTPRPATYDLPTKPLTEIEYRLALGQILLGKRQQYINPILRDYNSLVSKYKAEQRGNDPAKINNGILYNQLNGFKTLVEKYRPEIKTNDDFAKLIREFPRLTTEKFNDRIIAIMFVSHRNERYLLYRDKAPAAFKEVEEKFKNAPRAEVERAVRIAQEIYLQNIKEGRFPAWYWDIDGPKINGN